MNRAEQAASYFNDGYNCAQAVAMAFSDLTGMDEKTTARLISGFGGGIGRMREVCGAVTGMVFVLSQLYGYDSPNLEVQQQLYAAIQDLSGQFQNRTGSIICRDILKNPPSDPAPSPRTAEYYANRPCARMVYTGANLVEEYISNHPVA